MRTEKTTTRDMTEGNIVRLLIAFALPLMLGNVFQLLYNTVDSVVVGRFVGKEALAAVGSVGNVINILVCFFNGVSVGAGVVIGNSFGAKDYEKLHRAIETTIAVTLGFGVLATIIGVCGVRPMLLFMSTPEDVMDSAALYLRIYFSGIAGLLIYNMGSGILRAVGDTTRPLYFLILSSVLNILLDLLFVVVFKMGIAGVALATILCQFVSATLVLTLLTRTRDVYRVTWNDLKIDLPLFGQIFSVGLPAGFQSMVTAFSNVFVQSYINYFGSGVMAGWSCYGKLDQFMFLPVQSLAHASTTFVSQNMGAKKKERADKGTFVSIVISLVVIGATATVIWSLAGPAASMFSDDAEVIAYAKGFIRRNAFLILPNCVNHVLAGALRGRGDAKAPMVIMLSCFVGIRQLYLYVITHFVANTVVTVGYAYPVGWGSCCVVILLYYYLRYLRPERQKRLSRLA